MYVDGFVIPIKKKNVDAYKKMASAGGKMWKKHGALDYKECIGDDLNSAMGTMKARTFTQIAKAKSDETVIFSYIVYKSRKHRDEVNARVMKDPSMTLDVWKDKPMPFDMKKMAYGGFKVLVDEKR